MSRRRWMIPAAGLAALAIPTGVLARDTAPGGYKNRAFMPNDGSGKAS